MLHQELEHKLSATQDDLERERNRATNLKAEKDIISHSEQRLSHEVDALIKERQNQNSLLTNLQVSLSLTYCCSIAIISAF